MSSRSAETVGEARQLGTALREYRLRTGQTQETMAAIFGVQRKTETGWEINGRMAPRYRLLVREFLTEAGVVFGEAVARPDPEVVSMSQLTKAAYLIRLSAGPGLSETDAGILDDLEAVEVDSQTLAATALLVRIAIGPHLVPADGLAVRRTLGLESG